MGWSLSIRHPRPALGVHGVSVFYGRRRVLESIDLEVAPGLTFVGHVGATQFSSDGKSNGLVNYTDYKLGLGYDLGSGMAVEGAYVGATKKSDWGDINKARFVVTLSKSL